MNFNMRSKSSIVIDGREFSGKSVSISNGKVTIDGVKQDGDLVGDINITVNGDVEFLENECGTVSAQSVTTIKTMSGNVKCGEVKGSIKTMSGDVTCSDVSGNISTISGDIDRAL